VTGPVGFETDGPVATVTLDSPANRNAISAALLDGVGDAMAAATDDPAVRVILLTHTGPAFCAGADLKAGPSVGRHDMGAVLTAILDCPKPVVARIAGHCAGGGVGLAAAADISVVAAGARFAFSEVRIGVAPAIISVVCLAKMGRADALRLMLTGAPFDAAEAAAVGLVTTTVAGDDLDATVGGVVDSLLAGAPGALAATKGLVGSVPAMGRAEAFAWTADLSARLFAGAEAREGMAAFAAKRAPSWAGPGPGVSPG
jgi:methylglutaconyl-CoA hydratase